MFDYTVNDPSPVLAAVQLAGVWGTVVLFAALSLYGWLENRRQERQSRARQDASYGRMLDFLTAVRTRYR